MTDLEFIATLHMLGWKRSAGTLSKYFMKEGLDQCIQVTNGMSLIIYLINSNEAESLAFNDFDKALKIVINLPKK